ncbi:hypothetical protein STENM327S_04056 [Streptomyces tendae]
MSNGTFVDSRSRAWTCSLIWMSETTLDAERDAVLAALRPVVDGIAATFGPVCEAVLHDYRRPSGRSWPSRGP